MRNSVCNGHRLGINFSNGQLTDIFGPTGSLNHATLNCNDYDYDGRGSNVGEKPFPYVSAEIGAGRSDSDHIDDGAGPAVRDNQDQIRGLA